MWIMLPVNLLFCDIIEYLIILFYFQKNLCEIVNKISCFRFSEFGS